MPSSRAPATAASSSGISSAVRPKLGSQSCAPTPWRSHVSRSSFANRRTNGPAGSFQCFQYGSVANVVSPGSEATSFQSEMPWAPSVDGSRQIVFWPPRSATCATTSRRKSTTDASRNACISGVSSVGSAPPNRSAHASQRHAHRPSSSTPTWIGTTHAGSSQNTESAPASSTTSAQSLQKARYAGRLRHAAATRRPSSITWHASGWNATQRLSASPPNVRPSPHGLTCTDSPSACDASKISAIVPR